MNQLATKNVQELQTESQSANVMDALAKQIETGKLAPEQLSMMLDAQERILDRQAAMDFAYAMSACQSEMPQILKTEVNDQTRSNYESLDGLNKAISPVYTRHGFSISFGTDDCPVPTGDQSGMWLRITAEVVHRSGHSKNYHYDLPYDLAGLKGTVNKTKIHASGSTLTYGRRYLLKLIFNLITSDDIDDDGNAAVELIDDKQLSTLRDMINATETDETGFCRFCKVDSLERLPLGKYDHAYNALKTKLDNQK